MKNADIKYLRVLGEQYPNIASAATEIINLKAILSLPKGTEHFITDVHGEYEQFRHVMNSGSGAINRKIDDEFGSTLGIPEKRSLAALIYYPELKIKQITSKLDGEALEDWYKVTIFRLIRVCKNASSKYTRSKVRKSLPKDFAYIIEELMTGRPDVHDQEAYYNEIINTVISIGRASELITVFCHLVRRFTVDHLHVVGDIFDRGPYPHLIMDNLMRHHSVDIQWGNHDILWMGAAAGSEACICNVIRISVKYGNLSVLEDGYGINIFPLMKLAMDWYPEEAVGKTFTVKLGDNQYDKELEKLDARLHKAVSILQFKLEGQIINRHPEWEMNDRKMLERIDYEEGTITLDGITYELNDKDFPTVNPANPYELNQEEKDVLERLKNSFLGCEKLQNHIRFMFTQGSMYKIYNNNLLYHGCVPMNADGSFREVDIYGNLYSGKALYDILEHYARRGYYSINPVHKKQGEDILWFIWLHKDSPVYGKEKMATFERYFIDEKKTHEESKNAYYTLYENEETVDKILVEFGLPVQGAHIINGHVPVAVKDGESPVKCNGKLLVIDGGFSKAYQPKTGIAGYTLIYNSYGLLLAAHEPFESMEQTVLTENMIHSHTVMEQSALKRKTVGDTDIGRDIREKISELEELLEAYRSGTLVEKK